jgi:hypothetical protein
MSVRNYQTAFNVLAEDVSYKFLGEEKKSKTFGIIQPILKFKKEDIYNPELEKDKWIYKDGWGNPYLFIKPNKELKFKINEYAKDFLSEGNFIIFSYGEDGKIGTDDDFGNCGCSRKQLTQHCS